jgi:hypothetical protein
MLLLLQLLLLAQIQHQRTQGCPALSAEEKCENANACPTPMATNAPSPAPPTPKPLGAVCYPDTDGCCELNNGQAQVKAQGAVCTTRGTLFLVDCWWWWRTRVLLCGDALWLSSVGGECVEVESVCDGVTGACHSQTKPEGTPCGVGGTCKGTQCEEPIDCAANVHISLTNCKTTCDTPKMCICDLTDSPSDECWDEARAVAYTEKRGADWTVPILCCCCCCCCLD